LVPPSFERKKVEIETEDNFEKKEKGRAAKIATRRIQKGEEDLLRNSKGKKNQQNNGGGKSQKKGFKGYAPRVKLWRKGQGSEEKNKVSPLVSKSGEQTWTNLVRKIS